MTPPTTKSPARRSGSGPAEDLNLCFRNLCRTLDGLRFSAPAAYVYNPLEYAFHVHAAYVERYARRGVPTLLVGMNPGPWGMMQTGVPFGDVRLVADWLRLEAPVKPPSGAHPKRPVLGFRCSRREVSGQRLWGWAEQRFEKPERFFRSFFVTNYCPLAFLDEGGRNVTPDKLSPADRRQLLPACDAALARIVEVLRPERVLGVGRFARTAIARALPEFGGTTGEILHPSPASPLANRGWAREAERQLRELGALT